VKRSLIALAAALAVVATTASAPARAENGKTSIAIPILTVTFTPVYVALDAGFWQKAGLDVTLHDIAGLGATNAMLAGSVDFTVHSGPSLIRGNIRGQKMLAIALMANGVAFEISLRPEAAHGIIMAMPLAERARALKDKKIAVDTPNTIIHAFLRYVARKGGVDPEREITVSSMHAENALAAVKSGAIDGGVFVFPFTKTAQRQGNVLLASGITDVPEMLPFASADTATRPDFCDKHVSICEKLCAGYAAAHAFIHDHPAEALEILRKRMPNVHPDDLSGSFEQMQKTTPRSIKMSDEGLAHAQDLMVIGGMIKEEEKLKSFADIYTNKFIQ
jgi:NitT/TauT family transport system substrate-binding protein